MDENNIVSNDFELPESWDSTEIADEEGTDTEFGMTETDEPTEADQQTEESQDAEAEDKPEESTEPTEESKPEADQSFTLKHLDEVKTVTRDEVVSLAQKGMDYDRIRQKYDELKAEREKYPIEGAQFVAELAKEQGMSVADFIDTAKAEILAKKENIDYSVALEKVKLAREKAAIEAEKAKLTAKTAEQIAAEQAEIKRREDLETFKSTFPDVVKSPDFITKIPQSVWDDVNKGMTLTAAYTKYENARLKAEADELKRQLEAQKLADKNKARTTGARSTAGNSTIGDPWLADLEARL